MIIDFRVQPPYKSYLGIYFFRPRPAVEDPVRGNTFATGRRPSPSYEQQSIELFVAEMDQAEIELAVIMGQRAAARWGSVDNRDIIELTRRYPGRFVGFAGIDPLEPGAIDDLKRSIDGGCRGVALLPGWSDPPIRDDDERVYPVYEAAREMGALVMITSSHFIGPDMSYAMPVHIQHVALDFPDLTIIVGHGCWPWTVQACALAMRCPNVYLMPEFYMYLPNMPGADDYVRAANSYLSYRMLYSSCYPSRGLEQSIEDFKALPINAAAQANLLGKNAARLLGLAHDDTASG
jgi:predicted TIM-barrel fold metal-dependent hydrolase